MRRAQPNHSLAGMPTDLTFHGRLAGSAFTTLTHHAIYGASAVAPPDHDSLRAASFHRCAKSNRMQRAAAWAWFQHGGGGASASGRPESLMPATKRKSNRHQGRPSRFKLEEIMKQVMTYNSCSSDEDECAESKQVERRNIDAATPSLKGSDPEVAALPQRRHSFHGTDEERFFMDAEKGFSAKLDDIDELSKENGWNNCSETSSLLDKCEIETVWRQLLQYSGRKKSSDDSCANLKLFGEVRSRSYSDRFDFKNDLSDDDSKPHHQHRHHHHNHHIHHQVGAALHHLLRLLSKAGAGGVPVLCHSVTTVNSTIIPHHHHISSTKKTRSSQDKGHDLSRRHWRQRAMYDEGSLHNLHMPPHRDDEQQSWVPTAATSDVGELYAKVFQPLVHRFHHHHKNGSQEHSHNKVADALSEQGQHAHEEKRHGPPIFRSQRTTKHHHYHEHQHIHHHHHHHLHHVVPRPQLEDDQEGLLQFLKLGRTVLLQHVSSGQSNHKAPRQQQHIDQFQSSRDGFLNEKHPHQQNLAQCS